MNVAVRLSRLRTNPISAYAFATHPVGVGKMFSNRSLEELVSSPLSKYFNTLLVGCIEEYVFRISDLSIIK